MTLWGIKDNVVKLVRFTIKEDGRASENEPVSLNWDGEYYSVTDKFGILTLVDKNLVWWFHGFTGTPDAAKNKSLRLRGKSLIQIFQTPIEFD